MLKHLTTQHANTLHQCKVCHTLLSDGGGSRVGACGTASSVSKVSGNAGLSSHAFRFLSRTPATRISYAEKKLQYKFSGENVGATKAICTIYNWMRIDKRTNKEPNR